MFDKILLGSHPVQGFCLLGDFFFMTASISLVVTCLFRFSHSSWFSLGRLHVSRNSPISSRLSSLVAYRCFVIFSYNPLCLCGVSCYFSSFVSDFIYLGPLSFSLDESG